MLPDMRAVIAALVAAIGLLMIAFAAVATLRVAQESHAGSFQTDLARRGQAALPKPGAASSPSSRRRGRTSRRRLPCPLSR